ncbi:MAG: SUMF1/EgtB/PvdO family nonheme iron enzyme [Alkalinema sp. RU_4_3]|nr:SUMF1/EgtB/PvdO family nonheme iron enzyme [Alkalinema sp. RU_4_3]
MPPSPKNGYLETRAGNSKRGGSWNNSPQNCRSAHRNSNAPDNRNNNLGFRVVFRPAPQHSSPVELAYGNRSSIHRRVQPCSSDASHPNITPRCGSPVDCPSQTS